MGDPCGRPGPARWLITLLSVFFPDPCQQLLYIMWNVLQWQAFETVRQCHRRDSIDMLGCNFLISKISSVGLSGAPHYNIAAMPVHIKFDVDTRNEFRHAARNSDRMRVPRRRSDTFSQCLFCRSIFRQKSLRV